MILSSKDGNVVIGTTTKTNALHLIGSSNNTNGLTTDNINATDVTLEILSAINMENNIFTTLGEGLIVGREIRADKQPSSPQVLMRSSGMDADLYFVDDVFDFNEFLRFNWNFTSHNFTISKDDAGGGFDTWFIFDGNITNRPGKQVGFNTLFTGDVWFDRVVSIGDILLNAITNQITTTGDIIANSFNGSWNGSLWDDNGDGSISPISGKENITTTGLGTFESGIYAFGMELIDDVDMNNNSGEWNSDNGLGWLCTGTLCQAPPNGAGGAPALNILTETNPFTVEIIEYIINVNITSADSSNPMNITLGEVSTFFSDEGIFTFYVIPINTNELSITRTGGGAPMALSSISVKKNSLSEVGNLNVHKDLSVERNLNVKVNTSLDGKVEMGSLIITQAAGANTAVFQVFGSAMTDGSNAPEILIQASDGGGSGSSLGGNVTLRSGDGTATPGAHINFITGNGNMEGDIILDANNDGGVNTGKIKLAPNGGDIWIDEDSSKLFFGEAQDASIYYNGVDMIIDPDVVGSGQLKVDGDLNVSGNLTIRDFGFINQLVIGNYTLADLSDSDSLTVVDGFDLIHTATHSDDHAFEIVLDAAGFGDVKGIDINYITGAITTGQDEEAILINIDDFLSTGGTVIGLEIITTEGLADVYGMEVGALVNPILQLSGEFSNESLGTVNEVDRLAEFLSLSLDIDIFVNDNDNITIGSASKFEEIEFILNTTSSGSGISPIFEFSTGEGTWAEFNPTDGTNGMRNNGVVAWLDGDIPSWATTGGNYTIQITRTKNTLATNPIENEIRIVSGAIEYSWNKEGDISVNEINANALSGTYSNGEAYVCVYDNGTIFAKDSVCS